MGHGGVRLGPLALLLAVVSICVETLCILAISTASADLRIAERYADMVKTRYELETQGQVFLGEAREAVRSGGTLAMLPDTRTDGDGITWKEIWKNDYSLTAGIRTSEDGEISVVCWQMGRVWENQTDNGNLWNGLAGSERQERP